MRYLSLFSGIEAASVAWNPLGWECVAVAEIEPFPCAVLNHHYPDVPNLGDITKIAEDQIKALGHIDLIVGGFPCQDVSVAGQRKGFEHNGERTRSGLFFDAMRIVQWARRHCGLRFVLVENVPGLFTSNRGRDFAAVVREISGADLTIPDGGWKNTGVALGSEGLVEWCVLDAQFFGIPQRRRRIFAFGDFGDWASRPPILFESFSLQGHPAPCREARQRIAEGSLSRALSRVGGGDDPGANKGAPIVCMETAALTCGDRGMSVDQAAGGMAVPMHTTGAGFWKEGMGTLRAREQDSHENIVCMETGQASAGIGIGTTLNCNHEAPMVAHTLRGEGFDASPRDDCDTTLIPMAVRTAQTNSNGIGVAKDVAHTLDQANGQCIAFSCKDHGADAGETVPTLRFMGHDGSHANAGGQVAVAFQPKASVTQSMNTSETCPTLGTTKEPAVAFQQNASGEVRTGDSAYTLNQNSNASGRNTGMIQKASMVRRLTPRECERLQGFPDDYTRIPGWNGWRDMDETETPEELRALGLIVKQNKKGVLRVNDPDGPRYKALGNSMAVPVMMWIGERIQQVEEVVSR